MPLLDPSVPLIYGVDPKLASALTDPVRVRILEKLQWRQLSPSQFVKEEGGDLNNVARGFRYLKACGYAEIAEVRRRSVHGTSVEHVYRFVEGSEPNGPFATASSVADPDMRLPSDLRAFWRRIVEALAAGTFDNQIEAHSSWDTLVLDHEALEKLRARLDLAISFLVEAAQRTDDQSGSIATTIGFSILRSPQPRDEIVRRFKRHPQADAKHFELGPEVAKILSNPWRAKILTELYSRPLSPTRFVERIGGDPSYVARCFRDLSSWGLIELIEEKGGGRRGGGIERVFRNAQHCHFGKTVWATVPRFLRVAVSRAWIAVLTERLNEVAQSGLAEEKGAGLGVGFRTGAISTSCWRQLTAHLDEILDWLPQLQREAVERAGDDPSRLEPVLVSMACFESPRH